MHEQSVPIPEFGSKPEDITAFNEAIAAINAHNDQFSIGRMMTRVILDHKDKTQKAQELVDAGATQKEAEQTVAFVGSDRIPLTEEEQMARSIVGATNAPALEATGLTLSPLRTIYTMYNGDESEQPVGRVRLQVTNGSKFSGFLLVTNPEDTSEGFQKNAAEVVDSLIAEASDAIATGQDEQTALETLAYSTGIIAGLEHIGIGDAPVAKQLSDLAQHTQQGDIKEFILAERAGLLQKPGEQGFGPAKWQRDANTQFMADSWGNILNILKLTQNNPKAQELFHQLLKAAQADLDFARADWKKLKTEGYGGGREYGSGFEEIFQTVGLELHFLASPDEEKNDSTEH